MKILWQSPENIGAVDSSTLLSICLPAGRQVAAIRYNACPDFLSRSGTEPTHKTLTGLCASIRAALEQMNIHQQTK